MEISFGRIKQEIGRVFWPPKIILGRSACVGQDVLRAKNSSNSTDYRFINIQKGRLDLLLLWLGGQVRPKLSVIKPYMLRQDVVGLIKQQAEPGWLKVKNPDYLLMDVYAELTDQKFTHKQEGWSFCCHWSDIDHKTNFEEVFACNGLLPENEFEYVYTNFFNWFKKNYPDKKIVIVHYSAKYDNRDIFRSRVLKIKEVIRKQSEIHDFIYNLDINESDYFCFPYHYVETTIGTIVDKWTKLDKNI